VGGLAPPTFGLHLFSFISWCSTNMAVNCSSLEEVRDNIDRLDQQIVSLLAERGHYVSQAARFKKDTDGVKAPQRVEQVIAKVRDLSHTLGANPDVTEQVYRAMIAAFIQQELAEHAALGRAE
jgi:isochorismate pyruvate lyase